MSRALSAFCTFSAERPWMLTCIIILLVGAVERPG